MRIAFHWAATAAATVLVALAGCSGAQDTMRIAGDYKPLSACMHGELERGEIGVGYVVDETTKRARIWRDDPRHDIAGEEFAVYLTQTGPQEVTIAARHSGLRYAEHDFVGRLRQIAQRCSA